MAKRLAALVSTLAIAATALVACAAPAQAGPRTWLCVTEYPPYRSVFVSNATQALFLETHGWNCNRFV